MGLVLPLMLLPLLTFLVFMLRYIMKPTIQKYNKIQLLKDFEAFQQDISSNQMWSLKVVEPGLRMWSRSNSNGYRCEVVIHSPFEQVVNVLRLPSLDIEWNPILQSIQILHEEGDRNYNVLVANIYHKRLPGYLSFIPFKKTFTIARVHQRIVEDDESYLFFKSVHYPFGSVKPKIPDVVDNISQAGYKIKKIDQKSCHVSFSFELNQDMQFPPDVFLDSLYTRSVAFNYALGLREFFTHSTQHEIGKKISKDRKQPIEPEPHTIINATVEIKSEKPKSKLAIQGKRSISDLYAFISNESSWTNRGELNGVQMKSKKIDGYPLQAIMGVSQIKSPPRAIIQVIRNLKEKKKWDPFFAQGHVLEVIDDQTSVIYQAYEPIWPTEARDFISLEYLTKSRDGSIIVTYTETFHPFAPHKSGVIRASIVLAGFIIKPSKNFKVCEVTYVALTDLKGSLPQMLVNKVLQKNPLIVDGIRKIAEKLDQSQFIGSETLDLKEEDEYEEEDDDEYFEQDFGPSIKIESIPESPILEAMPQFLVDDTNDAVREIFEAVDCETDPSISDSGWVYVERRKDITISRKLMENSPIHCIKGEGVINRTAEEVRDFLLVSENRSKYDSMCKKLEVIKRYENGTQILYMFHTTNQCLLKTQRDFLVYTHAHHDVKTQRYAIVARSIKSDEYFPRNPDAIRARVLTSGWVLTPKGRVTLLSYIVQVDLGGKIPTAVSNVIAIKQPLCIHYLKEAMENENEVNFPSGSVSTRSRSSSLSSSSVNSEF